jgi:hypothetical protein
MSFKILIAVATTAVLVLAATTATAEAAAAATPTTTVQANLPGFQFGCSVTAFGPTFDQSAKYMSYQGGTSCSGIGASTVYKQVSVFEEVYNYGLKRWFTVTGSMVSTGLTRVNPQRASTARPYVSGHTYRIVAGATDYVPNGYAGCSQKGYLGCYEQVNITAVGNAYTGS